MASLCVAFGWESRDLILDDPKARGFELREALDREELLGSSWFINDNDELVSRQTGLVDRAASGLVPSNSFATKLDVLPVIHGIAGPSKAARTPTWSIAVKASVGTNLVEDGPSFIIKASVSAPSKDAVMDDVPVESAPAEGAAAST
ncbi:hypothetical protein MPER_12099 [Moniliophthora perniciosa FA553]|nr:hypothetical protein MPER_12099 [Moniliophthora perniciosa FA553]